MKHKIEINGIKISSYTTNGHDIIIPGGRDLLKNIDPIYGKILRGYFNQSTQGNKKWRVEFTKAKQKLLGHHKFSVYFHYREEAEEFIYEFEN